MKQKKYSESKVRTAQKFLSKYAIPFDSLDEKQRKVVISYTYGQKLLTLCLVLFSFSLAVSIVGAYLFYTRAQNGIDKITELSVSGEAINLHEYGHFCFDKGCSLGMHSFLALYMLLLIIMLPLILKSKRQILDAFLPAIRQSAENEQIPSN